MSNTPGAGAIRAEGVPVAFTRDSTLSLPFLFLFIGGNAAFGLYIFEHEMLSGLHALGSLGLGLWWAIQRKLVWVAYAGAYIVGGEVLWRMTDAPIPWEYAKYAIIILFVSALIAARKIRGPALALAYFILLLPSIWKTFVEVDPETARQFISFNLAGPFALVACAWFFSHFRMSSQEICKMSIAAIGPIAGIAANAIFKTLSVDYIMFSGDSNSLTSGGFAPNQVSPMLGLGAVLFYFILFLGRTRILYKLAALSGMLVLLFQSALTFSRSGPALAAASIAVGSFFLFRRARQGLGIIAVVGILFLAGIYIAVPILNSFTEGAFEYRASSTSTSNRADIALTELSVWRDNPLFGVGPGVASEFRSDYGIADRVAAHTEFTRMLAEHGMFGLTSIVILLLLCSRNVFSAPDFKSRAFIAASVVWPLMFMMVNAFRLVAPAFLIGLGFTLMRFDNPTLRRRRNSTDDEVSASPPDAG